ncbi:hypothetical protein RUMHYD_03058 [Blautia hydrogenotrophica DSM 10507]|uniref:Uncharacterized protein n=1 Tax=Blautia hydrogenotrophica (strain DSM 10507 / JCM 14656 / S5a33) TaxID=476272 RepID=C0CQA5_BLAHS|nr:hypothetical protein RUMHYD_03058 [Blautia hydrogenotrophica DSM 10507]
MCKSSFLENKRSVGIALRWRAKWESFSRNLHWTENRNSDIINKGNEIGR